MEPKLICAVSYMYETGVSQTLNLARCRPRFAVPRRTRAMMPLGSRIWTTPQITPSGADPGSQKERGPVSADVALQCDLAARYPAPNPPAVTLVLVLRVTLAVDFSAAALR